MLPYTAVLIVFLLISTMLILHLILPRFKEISLKIKSIEAVIAITLFAFCVFMVLPGTEGNYEYGDMKVSIKTPSKLYSHLGIGDQKLNVKNNDDKKTGSIIISADSNDSMNDLDFIHGSALVNKIYESEDGKNILYHAKIPPGEELEAASSAEATLKVYNWKEIKTIMKFWDKE